MFLVHLLLIMSGIQFFVCGRPHVSCFLPRTVSMFYFNDVALGFFFSVEFDSMIILVVDSPFVSSDDFIAKEFQTFILLCDCLESRHVLVLIAPVHCIQAI